MQKPKYSYSRRFREHILYMQLEEYIVSLDVKIKGFSIVS